MLTEISIATEKNNLLSALRSFDIFVPARTEGRKTHHVERWSICRLLSTLAKEDRLSYPVSLIHTDRPDFLLECNKKKIGVEVTEAISEQYAAYQALAEHEFPDVFLEPGHFRWGEPNLSVNEMRELLRKKQLTAPPWMGDRPEREWARYFRSVIEAKISKLSKVGFRTFDENWLAIYDNLPVSHIDLEIALGFLLPELKCTWTCTPSFSTIYIEHGPVIAKLSQYEVTHLVLNDLW